jgi:hypothetical protein
MLGRFTVVAGNFKAGNAHQVLRGHLIMKSSGLFREKIPLSQISDLDVASEEAVHRIGGAIALGVAGDVLFGPLGLVAGLLRGGRGKDVTFVCRLNDGRRFLAVAPSNEFSAMKLALTKSRFVHLPQQENSIRNKDEKVREDQTYVLGSTPQKGRVRRILKYALFIFVIAPIALILLAAILAAL